MIDLTQDVFDHLNVPGRRTTAEEIARMSIPAPVMEIQTALENLREKGLVSMVMVKGRDGITRCMWKRR